MDVLHSKPKVRRGLIDQVHVRAAGRFGHAGARQVGLVVGLEHRIGDVGPPLVVPVVAIRHKAAIGIDGVEVTSGIEHPIIGGDAQLLEALQQDILHHAQDATIFLRFLAAEAMRHTPALGVFNRFVQEGKGEEDSGINLKKRGVLPIVDLARVRALEGAITATHTEMRLQHAGEQGVMNPQDADDLIHALRFIGNVRLKHQVKRLDDGLTPNHLVDPDELSRLHQRYLRSAFGIVRRAHQALGSRYQL